MKKVILLFGCLAIGFGSWGQSRKATAKHYHAADISKISRLAPAEATSANTERYLMPKKRTCATVEYNRELQQKYPQLRESEVQFEQWINQKIQEDKANRSIQGNNSTQATLIKIPIIVHVIHNGQAVGSGANISAAQVNSQIDILNEDFRRKTGTPGFNTNSVGADMEIEFVPALRDPNGVTLAEPGIHRYSGGAASYTRTTINGTIKPATVWDPTRYFNFWTVTFGGADADLLGYAQFPNSSGLAGLNANGGSSSTDGVVMGHTAFGRVGTATAPYNGGRTATHEIGHWLGLRHIWGDNEPNCGDDYCNDTPASDNPNYQCIARVSCSSSDMIQNYMDYTPDACMNIFTNDQKNRMRVVMTNSPRRAELANSTVGTPLAGAPVAAFTSNTDGGCAPLIVSFTNTTTGGTTYSWSFPGGSPTTSTAVNPVVTYSTPGIYDVSLTATNANGSNTVTQTQYIFVGTTGGLSALPVNEGFQGATYPPTGWLAYNPDADTTWRKTNTVGGFGTSTSSIFINNYNYNGVGKLDGLFTGKYDFSTATAGQLAFDVAYARYNATSTDTLIWAYSIDCGNSFIIFYKKGGANLATNGTALVTSAFTPTAAQWRKETVTLPTILNGKSAVQLVLLNKCAYGNNLYLDNIQISVTAPAGPAPTPEFVANKTEVCTTNRVSFTNLTTGSATSYLWTFTGGTPATSTAANPVVVYNTAGTYDVTLVATNANGSNTITKTSYIKVGVFAPLSFSEGFEAATFPPTNWSLANPSADTITWKRYAAIGGFSTSTSSVRINNFNNSTVGRTDTLFTPLFNFSGIANANIDFDYAYARYNATSNDTLTVLFSTDCGRTYKELLKRGGADLATNGGAFVTTPFIPTSTQWIKVGGGSSLFANAPTIRFAFVNKSGYGNNLYIDNVNVFDIAAATPPVANFTSNKTAGCAPLTGVVFSDQSTNTPTSWAWTFVGGIPASSTAQNPTVSYNAAGTYAVTLTATNSGGSNSITKTGYITVGSTIASSSPITEDFQGATFPSTGWAVFNPDADTTWRKTTAVGGFGNSAGAAIINNSLVSTRNRLDALVLPAINLSAISNPRINFDVAYSRFSASFSDTLLVQYSTDCGGNYTTIWKKGGSDLSTTGVDQTTDFVPLSNQWRTEVLPLTAIASQSNVKLRIVSKNGYGNKIYVDNIQVVTGSIPVLPSAAFTSNKRGGCAGVSVAFTDQSTNTPTSWAWTFAGGTPASSIAQNPTVTYNTAGTYDVTLTVTNAAGNNTMTKTGYIVIGTVGSATTLPIVQGFEGTAFPPLGWSIYNPESDTTWKRTTTASGFGTSTASTMINLSAYTTVGRLDGLFAPRFNLSGVNSPEISFDVAYARYSGAYSDTLSLQYSVDCGVTFSVLWKKGGTELSTTGADQTADFIPTATQWRKETVSLASLSNAGVVQLALVSRNGYGNKIYLDNIRIGANTCTPPVATATPPLSSVCSGGVAGIALSSTLPNTTYTWTIATTGTVTGASAGNGSAIAQALSGSGSVTYTIIPTASNCVGVAVTATVTVNAQPIAQPSATNAVVCAGTAIQLNAATIANATYAWSGPNGFSSTQQNPTIASATTAMSGSYTLVVTANTCISAPASVTVTVNAKPGVQASATNAVVCTGSNIQLNATTVAGGTYAWTGPNGFSSTQQNPSITGATAAMAGPYSVVVTTNNCASSLSAVDIIVNVKPVAQPSATNAVVCAGSAIQLNAVTVANATYAWSGPNNFTSTQQNPTISAVTTAMSGTYSLTVTANGCASTPVTVAVTVNAKPGVQASATNVVVCTGSNIQLNATTVAGGTYAWTGPNGFSSTQQNPSITGATAAMAGPYSVVVTTNNCASSLSAVDIIVNAKPVAQPSATNATICAGSAIQLNAVTVANATYAWSGPNNFTSTQQNPTISAVTTVMSGTYSLTVTANGCASTPVTVTVTVNAIPGVQASATNAIVCAGSDIQLNATTVAGGTYAWTGPNGFSSTQQNPSITGAMAAMAGPYSVVVTTNNCASSPSTVDIVVNAKPVAQPSAANTTICTSNNIQLSAATVTGATYAWSGSNNFSSTEQNPSIAADVAGVYTYTLIVTVNGCTSEAATTVIIVNQKPTAQASTTTPTLCSGTTSIQLNAVAVTGATYAWSGPNSFTSTEQNPTISATTAAMTGVYSLVVTNNGCTSEASTVTVTINETPNVQAAAVNSTVCSGAAIQLTAPTVTGGAYAWSGPNGFISTQQNPTIAGSTAAMAGTYSLVVAANGCVGASSSIEIIVGASPLAEITTSTPVCEGGTFTLTATPVAGATYAWSGPNGFTSTEQNVVIAATTANAGIYTLNVNASGCTSGSSTTATVAVSPVPTTPGITFDNDTLRASTAGVVYTWLLNGDVITTSGVNSFEPTISGNYSVFVTNAGGCSSDTSVVLNVIVTGISANLTKQLSIYPNPSEGLFNVVANEGISANTVKLEVFDIQGRQLSQMNVASNGGRLEQIIDLSAHPSGMYILRVTDAQRTATYRLSKMK